MTQADHDSRPDEGRGGPAPPSAPGTQGGDGADGAILTLYGAARWDEACALLHRIYWDTLVAIARRRLTAFFAHEGLDQQVEDVAMEALHAIHGGLRRKAEAGTLGELRLLRAWIRRIVQNHAFDAMERRARRGAEGLSPSGDLKAPLPEGEDWGETRVLQMLDTDRRLQALRFCVADVGERAGDALRLWLGGRTLQEVAKRLAYRSVSGAQSAVQAAFERVKRCMAGKGFLGALGGSDVQ